MKGLKKRLNSLSIQDISVHGVRGLSGSCDSACESSCFEVGGRACQIDCAVDDDYQAHWGTNVYYAAAGMMQNISAQC